MPLLPCVGCTPTQSVGLRAAVIQNAQPHGMSCFAYCVCVRCRMSKAARAAAANLELYAYLTDGPPEQPAFDATAEAADAVTQLLGGDLVITTYDVLQQVRFSRV